MPAARLSRPEKIIIAHPQAVAGHTGIHGIGAVGDRVTQIFQVAGRGPAVQLYSRGGQGSQSIKTLYYTI